MSTDNSVFIIGGRRESQVVDQQQYTNILARYDGTWSIAGYLKQQRVGHASILINDLVYIFGGSVRNENGKSE